MDFVFLSMSKQVAHDIAYGWDYVNPKRPRALPLSAFTWGTSICEQLAHRGYGAAHLRLETADFVRGYFCNGLTATESPFENCDLLYTADLDLVRSYTATARAIILYHDHPRYAEIFDGVDVRHKPVVQIIAAPRTGLNFRPDSRRHRLLVNSADERERFRASGVDTEIFLKPAQRAFYEDPAEPIDPIYDVAFVAWDTAVERKRFDLFLSALEYASRDGTRIEAAVVARTGPHDRRIERLNGSNGSVAVHRLGNLRPEGVKRTFHQSRLTVVTSREDANPQVISESLACDTPVACARDITGGAFQIGPATGELFDPTPESLLRSIRSMLSNPGFYRPRDHCITLDRAVDQIVAATRGS